MKLEHLADESLERPLVRLYDFTTSEAERFLALVTKLASGETERVEVNGLPFVEPVGGCRLTLVLAQCGSRGEASLLLSVSGHW